MLYRTCLKNETLCGDNVYKICRPSILGNPYTHMPVTKTMAKFQCKSREEAIQNYSHYFDVMYGSNLEFTRVIDEIYEKYKNGEDVYLACFCPESLSCHGDIIIEKLRKRLIKEKLRKR